MMGKPSPTNCLTYVAHLWKTSPKRTKAVDIAEASQKAQLLVLEKLTSNMSTS